MVQDVVSSDDECWRDCIEYVEVPVKIHDYEFSMWQMEELPLSASLFMLDEMHREGTEISGQRLWAGSNLLSHYLAKNPSLVESKNILELGAGTGCCTMVASRLSPASIIATDGDSNVVELLERNLRHNKCDNTSAHELFWGNAASSESFEASANLPTNKVFDLIIAGDVLYKPSLLAPFFQTLKKYLKPSSFVLLCHIPRAEVTHDLVTKSAAAEGFTLECLTSEKVFSETECCPLEDMERGRIYKLMY